MAFDWRGGNITTMSVNGRLWEEGPNSFQPGDAWRRVANFLGKTSQPFFGESPDSRSSCQKCLILFIFYTSLGREVQFNSNINSTGLMCIETTACLDASTRVFPAHFVWWGERWAVGGAWCFGCGWWVSLYISRKGRWTPLTFHAVKPTKMVTSILNKPRLVIYW